ncbi:MAG: helix-turn-helix domain-containing protein [Spirochaetales bacterium]|nr:helix-turn-helix domain-containing protein [Candidatus Physcosoma equi]
MLGENISRIRKDRGLTQEAFAAKINVVRQTVSKWENGTAVPDADMLCRIADALEVSVSVLLGREDGASSSSGEYKEISNALAEINEQLALRNKQSRRTHRFIMGLVYFFIGFPLFLTLINIAGVFLFHVRTGSGAVQVTSTSTVVSEASTGIIGGADGPTAIYVTESRPSTFLLVLSLVCGILLLLGVGIHFLRKHRQER